MGPVRSNDSRTILLEKFMRPDATRFADIAFAERGLWKSFPTRQFYHSLTLFVEGVLVQRELENSPI